VLAGALAWRSRGWPLIHDAPLMHYIAWRIGEGAVPYRDVFDMNFPGVYLLHMLALELFGAGDAGWRAFDLAWLAGTSAAAAALAAPWGRLAAAGAGLFFATYHLAGGAWQAGQRDFLLCPFLLLAALGVARWAEHPASRASLAWGGLALGAGITVKPHAGLFAAALLVLVAAVAHRSGRASDGGAGASRRPAAGTSAASVAIFAVAILVPLLAVGAWLGVVGAWPAWYEIVTGYLAPLYSRLGRPEGLDVLSVASCGSDRRRCGVRDRIRDRGPPLAARRTWSSPSASAHGAAHSSVRARAGSTICIHSRRSPPSRSSPSCRGASKPAASRRCLSWCVSSRPGRCSGRRAWRRPTPRGSRRRSAG
jgi:hypothetical protein